MEEVWKDIAEFPGYQVSDLGRVRNADGMIMKQHLSGSIDGCSYWRISLRKNNKYYHRFVHRLECTAFIPNTENKKTVDHINKIKKDNRLENLRWATSSENGLNRTFKPNSSTGQSCIWYYDLVKRYEVRIKRCRKYVFKKCYLTLEEAVAGRDEFLASLSN